MSCGASTGGMSVLMRIFSKKYQMKIRSDLVVAHLGSQESESFLRQTESVLRQRRKHARSRDQARRAELCQPQTRQVRSPKEKRKDICAAAVNLAITLRLPSENQLGSMAQFMDSYLKSDQVICIHPFISHASYETVIFILISESGRLCLSVEYKIRKNSKLII